MQTYHTYLSDKYSASTNEKIRNKIEERINKIKNTKERERLLDKLIDSTLVYRESDGFILMVYFGKYGTIEYPIGHVSTLIA